MSVSSIQVDTLMCDPNLGSVSCEDVINTSSPMDQCNPETVQGFFKLLIVWTWHAFFLLLQGKWPPAPNFRRTRLTPIHTGGADYRYGLEKGGPQIFGGQAYENSGCAIGIAPEYRIRCRIHNGRVYRVGWSLRKPSEYSSPRETLAFDFPSPRKRSDSNHEI